MPAKLVIKCPGGFTTQGYQRCECWMIGEYESRNVSDLVANLFNYKRFADEGPSNVSDEELLQVREDKSCFFVLSGESFSLADLAEALKDLFNISYQEEPTDAD